MTRGAHGVASRNNLEGHEMKEAALKELFERLESDGETVIKLDGLENAIMGLATTATPSKKGGAYTVPVLVYSLKRIINILTADGMNREDALEYYSYNIERVLAYTLQEGIGAPVILNDDSIG